MRDLNVMTDTCKCVEMVLTRPSRLLILRGESSQLEVPPNQEFKSVPV